jgi:hypothetical protein
MARKVRQMRRKGKQVGLMPAPGTPALDIDARVALIPVALDRVMEEFEADVERLAGGGIVTGSSNVERRASCASMFPRFAALHSTLLSTLHYEDEEVTREQRLQDPAASRSRRASISLSIACT